MICLCLLDAKAWAYNPGSANCMLSVRTLNLGECHQDPSNSAQYLVAEPSRLGSGVSPKYTISYQLALAIVSAVYSLLVSACFLNLHL